ncbi:MAG: hypothetical protein Q7R64_01180, partial [bacterium]|nr:hypothetical protein [bacterium]
MLSDRPQEQMTLFKEIMYKKVTVREAENIARRIAYDRARKKEFMADPELVALEEKLREQLGTRVKIERMETGGKILIDFFSNDDLRTLLQIMETNQAKSPSEMLERHIEKVEQAGGLGAGEAPVTVGGEAPLLDDRAPQEKALEENEDIYSVKNFSI